LSHKLEYYPRGHLNSKISITANLIVKAQKIVIFVGAGLSTESGIPDYRSPGGLWDKYNPEDFYFQNFVANPTSREKYWQMATEMYEPMKKAKPNAGHLAIVELEKLGRLDCLITQNIDGLHFKAGNSESKVLELHGTALFVTCLSCHKRYDRDDIQVRYERDKNPPYCEACGGILKPATISFGQSMPEYETAEAYKRSQECDLFIVIGSSLMVQPAAAMPSAAKQSGAKLVIINRERTNTDSLADIVINDSAGPTMAAIVAEVKKQLTSR
jgi:NAD-dependent deacetylase